MVFTHIEDNSPGTKAHHVHTWMTRSLFSGRSRVNISTPLSLSHASSC
ncbi:hypothetical protein Nmel_008032, partial [Mimus melanotis]